jgi:asparagine synthase (glutamine-hydrolysing)
MPGFSAVRSDAGTDGGLARALEATTAFDHYATDTIRHGEVVVGRTGYDGYPLQRAETEHGTVYLEGRLYDVDDVEGHLERVAALIAADDVDGLREWVGERDGDFLIVVVDGEDVALLNDAFSRLPTYVAVVDGAPIASRELAVVREIAREHGEPCSMDRLAVGQYLTFGYTLGTRTLFEGVRAIPPGSLVRLDGAADDDPSAAPGQDPVAHDDVPGASITSVYEHDFEDCPNADRSVEANAAELTDRLLEACRRRIVPGQQTVVSLSGGLDSRTVAAAYAAIDAGSAVGARAGDVPIDREPTVAATFRRPDGGNSEEVAAAGAVAEQLDLDWTVSTADSSPERRETMIQAKQGMNYLGMAYILEFFEDLRSRHGTTTYVTGDGGDKLLVGLEPTRSFDTHAELVAYVIDANSRLPIEEAAAIAGVDPDAIRASVAERLRSYPESDRSRAYAHFLVRERGINFLVQGEDRNRYYAWTVSPFYALPVWEYAMGCPDEQKAYRRLQSAILERFDPALVDLPYPNYGAPISTRRYRAKQFVYDSMGRVPTIRDRVIDRIGGGGGEHGPITDAIRDDLPHLTAAGLSPSATADVIATPEDYSTVALQYLSTVTALASGLVEDRERALDSEKSPPIEAIDDGVTGGITGTAEQLSPDRPSASVDR